MFGFVIEPEAYLFTTTDRTSIEQLLQAGMAPDAPKAQDSAAPLLQQAPQLRELHTVDRRQDGLRLCTDRGRGSDTSEALRALDSRARPAAGLDRKPDRKSENFPKKGEKSSLDRERNLPAKMKKPSISRGLKSGAGEEGRTPDLMLGKHTL